MMADTELVWVCSYSDFSTLAHAPRGTEAATIKTLHAYKMCVETGELKHEASLDGIRNPAFLRHHPSLPLIYAATESIVEHGTIVTLAYDEASRSPALCVKGEQSAHGASTCYLALSAVATGRRWMLAVNYWDSVISVLPAKEDGSLDPVSCVLPPPTPVRARGLDDHLRDRQSEPHAHAVVLDPSFGRLAFVPDLGTDVVRMYVLDPTDGSLVPAGSVPCGPAGESHGPRYLEWDPSHTVAYVVNELSSTVAVFKFDHAAAAALVRAGGQDPAAAKQVLQLVQLVSTLDKSSGAPPKKNTCGRIAVSPNGRFVLVSNRGDDSIATFAIDREFSPNGPPRLRTAVVTKTLGATPRHFQFGAGGRFVIVANQDSDSLTVFRFCQDKGVLDFTGRQYACPSPNFVATLSARGGVGPIPGGPIPSSVSGELG